MISRDDVKKLANLARIKLTEKEEEKFAKEIGGILGYVDQIEKFSGESDAGNLGRVHNVLRNDSEAHESGINTEAILKNAPERDGDYIKVKKVLGE